MAADDNWALNNRWERDGGIPTQVLIGPGMEVLKVDAWIEHADIEAVLEENGR